MSDLSGFDELREKLERLATEGVNRIARRTLSAGLNVAQSAARSPVPQSLKSAIGTSMQPTADGYRGKVGVGVGRGSKAVRKRVLISLIRGTRARRRNSIGGKYSFVKHPKPDQLSTGQMRPRISIESAISAAKSTINQRMQSAFTRQTIKALTEG